MFFFCLFVFFVLFFSTKNVVFFLFLNENVMSPHKKYLGVSN